MMMSQLRATTGRMWLTAAGLLLAAAPWTAPGAAQTPAASASAKAPLQAPGAPASASPLTIVVFSDFACPYSAETYRTLEQLSRRNPGQLHLVFKQSPLDVHPGAELAHRAALAAAAQGRYDQMSVLLYANQQRQDLPSLMAYARELRLDVARFRRDLDSAAVTAELHADEAESQAFGIEQTPTLYLAGRKLVGTQTEVSLAEAIRAVNARQLQASAEAPAAGAHLEPAVTSAILEHPAATRGPSSAPLTIVEFTDFQCPYCRQAVGPMESFTAAHPGDVRWIVHSFPLDFHADSELANEAALAAGEQGRFWEMHDAIFDHQAAIKPGDLRGYAQAIHLDMVRYDEALADHRFAGPIAADRALGIRANVEGTPTFIVDGRQMSGALSEPELEQLLAQHKAGAALHPAAVATAQPAATAATDAPQILGADKAGITLTWYTDVRSSLAAAQADRIRALAGRYPDDLRVLYRPFPLATHPDAKLAAAALLAAAAEGRFWPLFDALAGLPQPLSQPLSQPSSQALSQTGEQGLTRASVLKLAASLSFSASFAAEMDARITVVDSTLDEAARRGILGAPVIFLNEKRVDGLQQESLYTALIETERDQQRQAAAPATAGGTR